MCLCPSFCLLQIIGPLEEGEIFNQDDFLLLESIILKTSGERIKSIVQKLDVEEDRYENQSAPPAGENEDKVSIEIPIQVFFSFVPLKFDLEVLLARINIWRS